MKDWHCLCLPLLPANLPIFLIYYCITILFQFSVLFSLYCYFILFYLLFLFFLMNTTAQVNEYKYEIERVNRELQAVKRKYYQQKRREQLMDELDGGIGLQGERKVNMWLN